MVVSLTPEVYNYLAQLHELSAPFYFALALILPVIVIFVIVRGLTINKILVDNLYKRRILWTVITVVFSLIFVEIDSVASFLGVSYDQYSLIRRPIGAIALIGAYVLVDSIISIVLRYDFSPQRVKLIRASNITKYVLVFLTSVLFLSPLFPFPSLENIFTFLIGVGLFTYLIVIVNAMVYVRNRLQDTTMQKYSMWISYVFVIIILVGIFNVVTILLGLPPSSNIFRIPFSLLLVYSAFESSRYLIETGRIVKAEHVD